MCRLHFARFCYHLHWAKAQSVAITIYFQEYSRFYRKVSITQLWGSVVILYDCILEMIHSGMEWCENANRMFALAICKLLWILGTIALPCPAIGMLLACRIVKSSTDQKAHDAKKVHDCLWNGIFESQMISCVFLTSSLWFPSQVLFFTISLICQMSGQLS